MPPSVVTEAGGRMAMGEVVRRVGAGCGEGGGGKEAADEEEVYAHRVRSFGEVVEAAACTLQYSTQMRRSSRQRWR